MTTKDAVLAELISAHDYISGEGISQKLRITRAAVNTAVKSLRAEGYEIDSVTRRGYRLVSGPDRITAGSLQALLGEERMRRVRCYDVTDSTNRRLQEAVFDAQTTDTAASPAPHGLIAVANEQTAGRGRLGRSFSSPHNMGIYLSILIRPEALSSSSLSTGASAHGASASPLPDAPVSISSASSWTALTSWTAVAVCRAIETVYDVRPGIKWVNDLYLDGKKICGILTQMDLETESGLIRDIIIGIGVNVQEQEKDFPEELQDIAGSLYQLTGKKIDRSILAAEMIRQLDQLCADWTAPYTTVPDAPSIPSAYAPSAVPTVSSSYVQAYRDRSLVLGKPIRVITPAGEKEATAESIGDDFSLHVRYADGTEEDLRGGEISIRSTAFS